MGNINMDNYIGPCPMTLEKYHEYMQLQILLLIDIQTMNRILEDGINEETLINELGITKEEYTNPTQETLNKVKKYLEKDKQSKIR